MPSAFSLEKGATSQPEQVKEFRIVVTPKLARKAKVILPGDIVKIKLNHPLIKGKFCLVTHCEDQWIEQYKGYKKKNFNYYAITKIVMMS